MAINLLPSEEKAKIKKEKQALAPLIQMTGPGESEKKTAPAVKGGGVLGFFKQAFQKPKKKTAEEEQRLAEKKIILEEKIVFAKPKEKVKPQIEFTKPRQEIDKQAPLVQKKPGLFARLFAPKRARPIQIEKKIVWPEQEEQFPKYQAVKAEKIMPQIETKPRPVEVIELTTKEFKPIEPPVKRETVIFERGKELPQEVKGAKEIFPKAGQPVTMARETVLGKAQAKPKGQSVWQRFSAWLKALFARRPKQKAIVLARQTFEPKIEQPKLVPPAPPAPVRFEQTIAKKKFEAPPPPAPKPFMPPKPIEKKELVPPPPAAKIEPFPETPRPPIAPVTPVIVKKEERVVPPPPAPRKEELSFTQPAEGVARPAGLDWEVNLVPEEALEHEIPLSKILYLFLAIIISMAVVFASWLAVNWYYNNQTTELNEINNDIVEADASIRAYKQLQNSVQLLKGRLDNARMMLDKHVAWSQLFAQLERYTVPETYYTSMTADVNGTVSLSAVAKNYESAVKQLYVFQKATDFVSGATISNISFVRQAATPTTGRQATAVPPETAPGNEAVTYAISLNVLPSLFYFPRN